MSEYLLRKQGKIFLEFLTAAGGMARKSTIPICYVVFFPGF
jgi:hypothetical protein